MSTRKAPNLSNCICGNQPRLHFVPDGSVARICDNCRIAAVGPTEKSSIRRRNKRISEIKKLLREARKRRLYEDHLARIQWEEENKDLISALHQNPSGEQRRLNPR